jgi:type II protein arginine methyltransferase
MSEGYSALTASAKAAFPGIAAQAQGDAKKLLAAAEMARLLGLNSEAVALALEARSLAGADGGLRQHAHLLVASNVPEWHFSIVRDEARNTAYDSALRNCVRPGACVLDIGTGSGLLAMMAARAGAGSVVACEMNPALASAARDVVSANGMGEAVRIIPSHSGDLAVEEFGSSFDVIVSEIISNNVVGQGALQVLEDAARRVLKPGGVMIPASCQVRVSLAYWGGLPKRRLGNVQGFDLSSFNQLEHSTISIRRGDARLELRSAPADLFSFDFPARGAPPSRSASIDLVATGGPVNGVVQWLRMQLDPKVTYENDPATPQSCWALLFYPFQQEEAFAASQSVRVLGAHTSDQLWIWAEA